MAQSDPTDPSRCHPPDVSGAPAALPARVATDWPGLLVEGIEEALLVLDTDWRVAFLNRHAATVLGHPKEALLGRLFWEAFPQLIGTRFEQLYRRVMDDGVPGKLEDMSPVTGVWYEVWVTRIAQGLIVAFRNIAERKRLEQALNESEARFKLLSDAAFEAVVIHQEGLIAEANQQTAHMFGYARLEALIGLPITRLVAPESLAEVQERIASGYSGVYRAVVLRSDGSRFAIEGRGSTLLYQGRPARVMALRDISEQVHAEAQLRAQAARLELLSEASHAFARAGLDEQALLALVVRKVVETLCDLCMIRVPSDDGQQLPTVAIHRFDTMDADTFQTIQDMLNSSPYRDAQDVNLQVFRTGQALLIPSIDVSAFMERFKPEHQAFVAQIQPRSMLVVPLQVQGRVIGVLGLYRSRPHWPPFSEDDLRLAQDLADRAALAIEHARLHQQAQRELAERVHAEQALTAERALLARRVAERTADLSLANAQLARAARLKDEFLANMSHELRTPLNAVLGRSQALQEAIYGPVTPEQTKALLHIEESGQHLLTLINDILDLSKIESGQLMLECSTLDVDLLCAMCMRMVSQMAIAKRIMISSTLDGLVETIQADERRLKQVLVNLLANAVKFTPGGGKVGLEVRGDVEHGRVTFTVWDTGIGIAAADLPKLFQPFVQLDSRLNREHSGTGLGLALVLRLAKAHGGSVAVESTPGQGSRFSVILPWDPQAQAAERSAPSSVIETSRPPIERALVIEDSSTAAAQLTRYLHDLGVQVEVLPYGADSVARAIALRPDVILLDLLLPDQDGWDVLRQLKAAPQTQAIPVLLVSVVDELEQARALGAAGLLRKPLDRATLVQALRRLFSHSDEPPVQSALIITPPLSRPRILLAEDNEANILSVSDYLQAKGYEVLVARNGSEALVRAQEERPELILMDIQMPGMDGLEAMRRIRVDPDLARVPIIAVTALAMPGDQQRCLAAGADAYLAKPVSLRQLLALVKQHRQQRADA